MVKNEKNWLNTAIVGTGRIYLDDHSRIYKSGKIFAPVAFVDWDEKRATNAMQAIKKILSKKKGDCVETALQYMKVYTSFEKMLDELEGVVDLVDNCTHNQQHIPLSIKALERNVNIQTEKPPSLNFLESKILVDAEKKSKAHYQLAENVCFEKVTIAMRKTIAEGKLGNIQSVEINFGHNGPYWPFVVSEESSLPHFVDPYLGGGGCLQDLAPHGISRGLWPLGDDVQILNGNTEILERRRTNRTMSGKPVDSKVDDFAVAEFECLNKKTNNTFPMKITTSWCGFPGGDLVKIQGEKGTMKVGRSAILKRAIPIIIDNDGKEIHIKLQKDKYHSWSSKVRETQMFADDIFNHRSSPMNSEFALKLQEIISLHYFSKMKRRKATVEEMENWGDEILSKHNGDWQKASREICGVFVKSVDLK